MTEEEILSLRKIERSIIEGLLIGLDEISTGKATKDRASEKMGQARFTSLLTVHDTLAREFPSLFKHIVVEELEQELKAKKTRPKSLGEVL